MMNEQKKHLIVVAALIEADNRIVIAQRYDHDAFGSLWEFPGGVVEDGETLEQALKREIKEELGVVISVDEFINIFEDENETLKITVHLFRCTISEGTPVPLECKEVKFLPFSEIYGLDLAPVDRKIHIYLSSIH